MVLTLAAVIVLAVLRPAPCEAASNPKSNAEGSGKDSSEATPLPDVLTKAELKELCKDPLEEWGTPAIVEGSAEAQYNLAVYVNLLSV